MTISLKMTAPVITGAFGCARPEKHAGVESLEKIPKSPAAFESNVGLVQWFLIPKRHPGSIDHQCNMIRSLLSLEPGPLGFDKQRRRGLDPAPLFD